MLREAYVSHMAENAAALADLRESLESKPEVSDECFMAFAQARDADNAAVRWLLSREFNPPGALEAIEFSRWIAYRRKPLSTGCPTYLWKLR